MQTGCNVMAWLFLHEGANDGEVEYVVRIPVRPRSKLSDEEPTEVERNIINDLVALVNRMYQRLDERNAEIDALKTRVTDLENRIPTLGGGWKLPE